MLGIFTNRPRANQSTINFFYHYGKNLKTAQLACPFFTSFEPLQILVSQGCEDIKLLVRLCDATSPDALEKAFNSDFVKVRFYTSERFHAKFYILDKRALVGSANLTRSALTSNRELSVVIDGNDERFSEIVGTFDELWSAPPAATLTSNHLVNFRIWHRSLKLPSLPQMIGIEQVEPPNVRIGSDMATKERTFLETFRAEYQERIIPAYTKLNGWYFSYAHRHPHYKNLPLKYELDRFVSWARFHKTDAELKLLPVRRGADLESNVKHFIKEWMETDETDVDLIRLKNLEVLKQYLETPESIDSVQLDVLVQSLTACAAFHEQQRFIGGGLTEVLRLFREENTENEIKAAFKHLFFGQEDFVKRTYDCIFDARFKLTHWGQSCVWELFGWFNNEGVPPVNGRVVKGLRLLGFDVPIERFISSV